MSITQNVKCIKCKLKIVKSLYNICIIILNGQITLKEDKELLELLFYELAT